MLANTSSKQRCFGSSPDSCLQCDIVPINYAVSRNTRPMYTTIHLEAQSGAGANETGIA